VSLTYRNSVHNNGDIGNNSCQCASENAPSPRWSSAILLMVIVLMTIVKDKDVFACKRGGAAARGNIDPEAYLTLLNRDSSR